MDLAQAQKNHQIVNFTLASLLFLGLLYVFVCNEANVNYLILPTPFQKPQVLASSSKSHAATFNVTPYEKDELLEEVLAETSTQNKTMIIAMVNKAYVEGDKPMLDIFLHGFWLGENTRNLVDHLLIVAADQTSYDRCKYLHLHCYKLKTDGVDFMGEKLYMSEDFINMMWRRTLFLTNVLKHGYNFIFTDADVLWLRNPFPNLIQNQSIDIQISVDYFIGHPWSECRQRINTGFYMINSNHKTIALFDSWYAQKNKSEGLKEQDVLEKLMRRGLFRRLGIKARFLDTLYFSGFCQDSRDVRVVSTVHANCCRSIHAKVTDLTSVIHDWKRFFANQTVPFRWSPHNACMDSWRNR
ncbi:uncharacterized protein At1g28695 [Daucus carota subsp. sativus]|uniref:uncharacterized protein At1g28695 n=1 Tax=Daucus carota subsp. sativus TaxID=79200 RepID=UPI0007EFDDD4|nr:PREDICTED: uncharacterized protein At1g28695-like [Daucus carota subsp. sativus]